MIIRSRRTFWEGMLCPAPEFAPQGVGARGTDGAGNARRLRSSPCGANSAVWNRKGERRQNRKFKDCFSSVESVLTETFYNDRI